MEYPAKAFALDEEMDICPEFVRAHQFAVCYDKVILVHPLYFDNSVKALPWSERYGLHEAMQQLWYLPLPWNLDFTMEHAKVVKGIFPNYRVYFRPTGEEVTV